MIEHDFPALRSAVRESVIGRTIASITAAVGGAIAHSSAARLIRSQASASRGQALSETIRLWAIAVMTAGFATWALSWFVPPYVSTAIPRSAFLLSALVCAAAAAGADALGDQWSRSRLRRVTAWLRGA